MWAIAFSFTVAFLFRYHLKSINHEISNWPEGEQNYPFKRKYFYASLECVFSVLVAYIIYLFFFSQFPDLWAKHLAGLDVHVMRASELKWFIPSDLLPVFLEQKSFFTSFTLLSMYLHYFVLLFLCLKPVGFALEKVLVPFDKVCKRWGVRNIPTVAEAPLLYHMFIVFCCLFLPQHIVKKSHTGNADQGFFIVLVLIPYVALLFTALWRFRFFEPNAFKSRGMS